MKIVKSILKNYYFSKIIVVFQDICPVWGSTCKVIRDPLKLISILILVLFLSGTGYAQWQWQIIEFGWVSGGFMNTPGVPKISETNFYSGGDIMDITTYDMQNATSYGGIYLATWFGIPTFQIGFDYSGIDYQGGTKTKTSFSWGGSQYATDLEIDCSILSLGLRKHFPFKYDKYKWFGFTPYAEILVGMGFSSYYRLYDGIYDEYDSGTSAVIRPNIGISGYMTVAKRMFLNLDYKLGGYVDTSASLFGINHSFGFAMGVAFHGDFLNIKLDDEAFKKGNKKIHLVIHKNNAPFNFEVGYSSGGGGGLFGLALMEGMNRQNQALANKLEVIFTGESEPAKLLKKYFHETASQYLGNEYVLSEGVEINDKDNLNKSDLGWATEWDEECPFRDINEYADIEEEYILNIEILKWGIIRAEVDSQTSYGY